MVTPADVMAQALGMAQGSRFERARAGASALSSFLQLGPDDKRDLAVLVAQRAAPDLVPRIQAEAGLDLTAEQSRAVLDMVGRLDGDDIRELQSALATPEARARTMRSVGDAAAAATGMDDVVADRPEPEQPTPRQPTQRQPEPDPAVPAGTVRADLAGQVAELQARLAAAENEARTASAARDQALADRQAAEELLVEEEVRLQQVQEAAARTRRDLEGQLDEARRELRRARRLRDEARDRAGATPDRAAPSPPVRAPGDPFDDDLLFERPGAVLAAHAPGGDDVGPPPDPDPGARAAQLAERIRGRGAGSALRTVTRHADDLAGGSVGDLAAVLHAVPDGWARRRALERLVEAGAATATHASLLGLLARTGDQVFAAGAFLDAGVPLGRIEGHVGPDARARLARRAAG